MYDAWKFVFFCGLAKYTKETKRNSAIITNCLKMQKIKKIIKKSLQIKKRNDIINLVAGMKTILQCLKSVEKSANFEKSVDNSICA